MCIIVDANVVAEIVPRVKPAAQPVMNLIWSRKLAIALGGSLTRELIQGGMGNLLTELERNRLIHTYDGVELEKEACLIAGRCRSNDAHIIALARISGARILYSHDHSLHRDFSDRTLINEPRGKTYQDEKHAHLLRDAPECKKSRNDEKVPAS